MGDYWKAVYANKATLTGYTLIAGAVVAGALGINDVIEWSTPLTSLTFCSVHMGLFLNMVTRCGIETMHSYRKARSHIEKHGTIDPR